MSDTLFRIVADTSKYLEYLEKEMTIMGILSTFCAAAAVALVPDRLGSADLSEKSLFAKLWIEQPKFLLTGVVLIAVAGALFFMQRSALAWFYGQIGLSIESPAANNVSTETWYRDADSWATWIPYQSAFTALTMGAVFLLVALLRVARIAQVSTPLFRP